MAKLLPEHTGVNPNTGEYLSPEQRKAAFKLRKRKIDPKKVFEKKDAIVKVDKKESTSDPRMDAVEKSIENIQRTLKTLQSIIVTEAVQKKKQQAKENRKLLLEGETKKRKAEEKQVEGVPEKMRKSLLSPIKKVGADARGILGRLMEAFQLIFTGWLADKGLKAIQAFMSGDKKKLKDIGMNVLAGLGIVGGIFLAMNVGLLALPLIIGKVIAVIASVGAAIIGFLLSPPGLITLAIVAGIGAAIIGISKLMNWARGGTDASDARKQNRELMKEKGVEKAHISGWFGERYRVERDGEKVKLKYSELTPEEQAIVDEFKSEDQRIKDTTAAKNKEIKDAKAKIDAERKPEGDRLKAQAQLTRDYTKSDAYSKETKKLKREAEKKIKEKYKGVYAGNSSDGSALDASTTSTSDNITSSNNVEISSSVREKDLNEIDNNPKITINNTEENNDQDQSLKNGDASNVPILDSKDPNNIYSTYSEIQYGVIV